MATVTLNGGLIAQTANMFHRPVWDVTSSFKPGADNLLEVRFDSPALASSANLEAVRARPGRLSALGRFHSKSVLYGAFAWAHGALRSQNGGFRRGQRTRCVR